MYVMVLMQNLNGVWFTKKKLFDFGNVVVVVNLARFTVCVANVWKKGYSISMCVKYESTTKAI